MTSPGRTVIEMPDRAMTEPKCFTNDSISGRR